jgi:hypothetical protein
MLRKSARGNYQIQGTPIWSHQKLFIQRRAMLKVEFWQKAIITHYRTKV